MALLWCQPMWAAQGSAAKSAPAGKLVITGSSTMAPLVTEIARRFEARYPGMKVEVRAGGSGKGISDLREGTSTISMASRALLDSEKDLFGFPIARDGVALIVHRDNPIKSLSEPQVRDVLTGKISNWQTVGGRNAAVMLIWRGKGQGSAEFVAEHFNLSHADVRAQATIADNEALVRELESRPDAVASFSVGEAERRMQAGARIKMLAFGGIAPSGKTIRNSSYALSRPLTLVTRHIPEGAEKRFIEFALSGHVANLLAKYDFVGYEE
jgi:phosphate transport system substrate-binding protein